MSRIDPLSEIDKIVIEGQRWNLFDDPVGQALLRIYRAGVLDSTTIAMIQGRVVGHQRGKMMSGTPFEIPQLIKGDHVFGLSISRQPLLTYRQYRNGHSLTVSGSGGGKTTKACYDAAQIIPHTRGSWLIDLRKRGFRGLRRFLRRYGIHQQIITAHDFKLNPLQVPQGVDPREFAPRVAEMLIDVLGLPPRASKLNQIVLLALYRQYGILDGSQNYPTLLNLRTAMSQESQANVPAKQAFLDSLDPIISSMGSVFAYRVGWATHDLARQHLIFELGGIAEVGKNLLLNALILPEFTSRIARGVSNPKMDLWICCDEAQRICSATRSGGGSGAISDMIGLIRGTGIGLDLAVQSAADISPFILSNTAIKVIGRCGNSADYALIGASMGMTSEQLQFCHFNLRPGVFVGQLGEGHWRYPFLFQIPSSGQFMAESETGGEFTTDTTDIIEADGVWNLPTVPATEFVERPAKLEVLDGTKRDTASSSHGLDDSEIRFLKAVIQEPGLPSSDYVKIAAIGTRKARSIREVLSARGYLRVHPIATGKRGRNSLVLEPTNMALNDFAVPEKED